MRIERFEWDGQDAVGLAKRIRAPRPALGEVSGPVAEIIAEIRSGGDSALAAIESRFGAGRTDPDAFRQSEEAVRGAPSRLAPELLGALETAAANIRAVAEAQLADQRRVELAQGQTVELREVPVGSAGIYAPGGAAAYPSTVLMGCIPAKVAGVERVVLATPPAGGDQPVSDVVLAAAGIGGADEVFAVGGAQAVAALALGTERIAPVDVIAGPGNRYVQEAKRQLVGEVGIDGIAGPSELMVIAGDTAKSEWLGLDLCAQAEHGHDGLLVAAAVEIVILDAIEEAVHRIAEERGIADDAALTLVAVPDTAAGVTLANALAPEHLEILTEDADLLARGVATAGCVFVGEGGATAFGDYAAGSNHVLPTGGAGRFQGPLGPGAFRRRIPTVEVTRDAARELAPAVATLARAEGFPLHADSAEARCEGAPRAKPRSDPIDGEAGPDTR
ncbi:MAG: histidinol dehydrogenase [Solirubrobacterales bacterium]|nr:histidinol dehydrogenase [Solirubrobacterales bacterium]